MSDRVTFLRFALLIVAFLLIVPSAYSQVEISGYFEPQFMGWQIDTSGIHSFSTKLRVDIERRFSDNVYFGANINYSYYSDNSDYGRVGLPIIIQYSNNNMIYHTMFIKNTDEIVYDNAFIRFNYDNFSSTLGRQQISLGSGYAWNPTDVINIKDIFDPTYEKSGVDAIRVNINLYKSLAAEAYYFPGVSWNTSTKLVRLLGTVSQFDFALSICQKVNNINKLLARQDRDVEDNLFGFDVNGELFGIGIWTENMYYDMKDSIDFDYWENLIGVDYTFNSGWYMMAEYYYNECGKKSDKDYTISLWGDYFFGYTKTLARDQLYFYTFYPITDLIDIGSSVVYAISDQSAAITPTIKYSLADDVELTAIGSMTTGKYATMYSKQFGYSGLVRIRAYF